MRHRRLEHHRFIGTRDTMRVYDTDDDGQAEALLERIGADDLIDRTLISTFGPDSLEEARSRGFRPA
ncbi:MAG: hypothetical protein HKN46_01840 [Acidimicrobiia bacterium]|nr:hypothetical protein [Acidimicrobiia bacterium]